MILLLLSLIAVTLTKMTTFLLLPTHIAHFLHAQHVYPMISATALFRTGCASELKRNNVLRCSVGGAE